MFKVSQAMRHVTELKPKWGQIRVCLFCSMRLKMPSYNPLSILRNGGVTSSRGPAFSFGQTSLNHEKVKNSPVESILHKVLVAIRTNVVVLNWKLDVSLSAYSDKYYCTLVTHWRVSSHVQTLRFLVIKKKSWDFGKQWWDLPVVLHSYSCTLEKND